MSDTRERRELAKLEEKFLTEYRALSVEHARFRMAVREALFPFWPNNPCVGNDEIIDAAKRACAAATPPSEPEPTTQRTEGADAAWTQAGIAAVRDSGNEASVLTVQAIRRAVQAEIEARRER